MRARQINILGRAEGVSEARSRVLSPGDTVLVERGRPRALVMKCPDGCGDVLTINLDAAASKAWRLYERRGKLTVFPSIWRTEGCESHFVVWRDLIEWCDLEEWSIPEEAIQHGLESAVARYIEQHGATHFAAIAEALQELPWSVLTVCKRLKKKREVLEFEPGVFVSAANPPQ